MRLISIVGIMLALALVATSVACAAIARPDDVPVMSGEGMTSKLGLLYIVGETESQGMLMLADRGRVPIIKVCPHDIELHDSRARRVKAHNPDAIVVVSFFGNPDDMNVSNDPVKMVVNWLKDKEGYLKAIEPYKDQIDFLEVMPNMWEPKTVEMAEWYSRYVRIMSWQIAQRGYRPIVLTSGVGGLPTDPEILDAMAPGLRAAQRFGGAWSCHGYTINYTMDTEHESHFSLRHRLAYDYLREAHPDLVDFPMIFTEGGVDILGNPDNDGWLARGTKEQFIEWLKWYDSELMKDPQVLGVTLFKIGAPSIWKSFELEPVTDWLADYLDERHESVVTASANLGVELPLMTAEGMRTKLGLLYLGAHSPGLDMLLEQGNIPIMKLGAGDFNAPNGVAHRLKRNNPNAIIFVGAGVQSSEMRIERDPEEVFEKWLRDQEGNLNVYRANSELVDYLSFMPNMWEPKTVEQADWYCRYVAIAAPKIAEMGFRPIILQSGVGGLPTDPEILDAMIPAFRLAKKYGGAWACHGYTIDYTMDTEHEAHYALRHRPAYEYLRAAHPDVADLTMIHMEAGVDKLGDPDKDGWLARGTKEEYIEWLEWFDGELMKDSEVLGAAIFSIGGGGSWASFEMETLTDWMADYLAKKNKK